MALAKATQGVDGDGWVKSASGGNTTSRSVAYSNSTNTGSVLIAVLVGNIADTVIPSFSDTTNGAWTVAANLYNSTTAGRVMIAYCVESSGGSRTVVADWTGGSNATSWMGLCELTGADTTTPLADATTNGATGSTIDVSCGSLTTSGDAYFVGVSYKHPVNYADGGTRVSPQSGFTTIYDANPTFMSETYLQDAILTGAKAGQALGLYRGNDAGTIYTDNYYVACSAAFAVAGGTSVAPLAMSAYSRMRNG